MDAFAVPRRIRPLDPLLANQIAAGEVVERPASVVKELLENSLDAGARAILVEIEQGGSGLIRVRDDGCGITRDDLPLALAPHATSKVYTQQELMQVRSLGFRGEALASIASVSRLSLESRSHDDAHGWRLVGSEAPAPSAHPVGSTIEVRDLFFNTPARRKFLRSERTEFEHVAEVVRRIALSRFDIALTLRHNQRQVLQATAVDEGGQTRRLEAICGRPFMRQVLSLDYAAAGLRLWGWVAPAVAARSQADLQYFYINGRVIRDRVVTHALRLAYGDQLFPGRHPAYVLYLEIDPAQVDVNVHPTKHEVRFREARLVHDFLLRALREALAPEPGAVPSGGNRVAETQQTYRPAAAEVMPAEMVGEVGERLLGLLHGRYLVVESVAGLRLVDVLAARRTLVVERMHGAFAAEGGLRGQPLLLPLTLNLSAEQMTGLERAGDEMQRFGFGIEQLGPRQVVVRQIPALLRGSDIAALAAAWLEAMAEGDEAARRTRGLQALAAQVPAMVPERGEWPALASAGGDGIATEWSLAQLAALLEPGCT